MEIYSESSKILSDLTGPNSIDFLLSLLDIGDIHMEKKEFDKAKGFYDHVTTKIDEHYPNHQIFKHRINSALTELYAASGDEKRVKVYQLSMDNLKIA